MEQLALVNRREVTPNPYGTGKELNAFFENSAFPSEASHMISLITFPIMTSNVR
jgi:hypothetical protein